MATKENLEKNQDQVLKLLHNLAGLHYLLIIKNYFCFKHSGDDHDTAY